MAKNNQYFPIYLFLGLPCFILAHYKSDNLAVWFNPLVSIKDSIIQTRYNESTLLPLLELIGTRFSKVLVHIYDHELLDNTHNALVAESVAKLNLQKANSTFNSRPYLQTWVSFHYNALLYISDKQIRSHLALLSEMVHRANRIYPGSVDLLSFHTSDITVTRKNYELLLKVAKNLNQSMVQSNQTYKLGIMYDVLDCQSSNSNLFQFMKWVSPYTNHVFVDALTKKGVKDFVGLNSVQPAIEWMSAQIEQCSTVLKRVYGKRKFELAFYTGWPDTDSNGVVNMANLVAYWNELAKLGNETGMHFIMDRAFDNPQSFYLLDETYGWWRLKESPKYLSPKDYVFEEKAELVKHETKDKLLAVNATWLTTPSQFSYNYTGLFVNVPITELNIQSYLLKVMEKCKRIVIRSSNLPQSNFSLHTDIIPAHVANLNLNTQQTPLQVTWVIDIPSISDTLSLDCFKYINGLIKKANDIYPETVDSVLFALDNGISLIDDADFIRKLLNDSNTGLRPGVVFPLRSWCLQSSNTSYIGFESIPVIAITTDVDWLRLTTNVERYLSQFITLLELCRNRINNQYLLGYSALMFLVEWVDVDLKTSNFQSVVNFVKFWEGLSEWAEEKKNVVVILGKAFDSVNEEGEIRQDGWWTVAKKVNQTGNKSVEIEFISKKATAYKLYQDELLKRNAKASSLELSVSQILAIVGSVIGILVVVVIVQVYFWRRTRLYKFITKDEIREFFHGKKENKDEDNIFGDSGVTQLGYDKSRYEIKKGNFTIDISQDWYLGGGEYGRVCKGKIFRPEGQVISAAVKMPKIPPKSGALLGLLTEIKVLSYIGKHENVVGLLGAYTEQLPRGVLYVFIEYCQLGSLYNFLRELDESSTNPQSPEISSLFFQWTVEIAKGMEFLASKHIVHLDLATRNILLDIDHHAKIADFGLSRRLYNYQCYVKTGADALPWRWMAPESLKSLSFTEKSDVWAFAVAMWEMYTLGKTPYSEVIWDANFIIQLENGLQLPDPQYAKASILSVMKRCWNLDPTCRPKFVDILVFLELGVDNESKIYDYVSY